MSIAKEHYLMYNQDLKSQCVFKKEIQGIKRGFFPRTLRASDVDNIFSRTT